MARTDYCDLVLPYIDGCSEVVELNQMNSLWPIRKLQAVSVPAPSAGEIEKSEQTESAVEVTNPKRGGNVFLSCWKSQNAKTSFRNIVRAIIRASRWKIPLVSVKEDHSTEEMNKTWYEEQDTLHFNVNAFKAGSSGNAGLSKRARFILMKNAWERTEEELELIHSVVNQMKCFVKYPNLVRRELGRVLHFETFEDGRVIIQEGHHGFSMYFIVTGSVIVQVTQVDTRTGEKKNHVVAEIPAGSSFGELALIQDCKRTATIACKGTSQFLRVDKPDFDMVLRRSIEQEWHDRLNIIKNLPFFSNWEETDRRHINLNCRVDEFDPQTVILGDTSNVTEHIYFIVSGICKLVRKVTIMETASHLGKGQTMLSLPPPGEAAKLVQSKSKQISTRFLVIGYLESGDYFGVGENLESTYILTSMRVECLVVPRHAIVALERLSTLSGQTDVGKKVAVREMLLNVESRLLSEEEAFEKWMTNLRWKNYRRKTINEVILTRKTTSLRKFSKRRASFKNPPTLVELQAKSSSLGYPLANSNQSKCPVYRRAGYQKRDAFVLPTINNKQEEQKEEPKEEESCKEKRKKTLTNPDGRTRHGSVALCSTVASTKTTHTSAKLSKLERLAPNRGPRKTIGKQITRPQRASLRPLFRGDHNSTKRGKTNDANF